VTELIERHRVRLTELCLRHQVKTLEIFGSAATGAFDPLRSDVDFLVDFLPAPPASHSRAYFGLWFGLQDLYGRRVDLVETPAVHNPYFLEAIRPSRRLVYAA
jgi:hypothetical protein